MNLSLEKTVDSDGTAVRNRALKVDALSDKRNDISSPFVGWGLGFRSFVCFAFDGTLGFLFIAPHEWSSPRLRPDSVFPTAAGGQLNGFYE